MTDSVIWQATWVVLGVVILASGVRAGVSRRAMYAGRAAVAAAAEAVRAASEARRVVAERYQAGVIAQIEVLDAEYALLQSELDRARALAGVRLSEARLARAIGR